MKAGLTRQQLRHESRTGTTFKRFVRDLCAVLQTDELVATRTAATVLCHLERRIHGDEAKDLNAQLPQKLQEILTGCPVHAGERPDKLTRAQLLRRIEAELELPEDAAEARVRGVFEVLASRVSAGELRQVIQALPRDWWGLWPEPIAQQIEAAAISAPTDLSGPEERASHP